MTPTQAYELARMFAARIRVLSEMKDRAATEIAQPQEAGTKGEWRRRELQQECACIEYALSEVCHAESQVRRMLGLEHDARTQDASHEQEQP